MYSRPTNESILLSEGEKVCVRSNLNCPSNLMIVVAFIRNICHRLNWGEFHHWLCNSSTTKSSTWNTRVWTFKGDAYLLFNFFFRHFVSVHLHVVCMTMYMYVTLSFYHDVCFTWIKRSLKITMTLEKIFHKKLCFCVVSDTMTFWELILALLQSSWIYFCNVLFRYYWPS